MLQSEDDTYDCTIDLDEVLDLETEKERWLFLQVSGGLVTIYSGGGQDHITFQKEILGYILTMTPLKEK